MLAQVLTRNEGSCDQPCKSSNSDNKKGSLPPMNNHWVPSVSLTLLFALSKDANENHAALVEPLKQSFVCCFLCPPQSFSHVK